MGTIMSVGNYLHRGAVNPLKHCADNFPSDVRFCSERQGLWRTMFDSRQLQDSDPG
jgi:hypothetical protein